ncbi:MAG: hypothetical protein AAGC60_27105 [Acidobacteriota bacterium]
MQQSMRPHHGASRPFPARGPLVAFVLAIAFFAVAGLSFGQLVPSGGEFRVNTTTAGNQGFPAVAMAADGDFVIAWESGGDHDTSGFGVFARLFDADTAPESGELAVNTFVTDNQWEPAVAFGPTGDFVVVWESEGQDGSLFGVYAQRFDAAGMPLGDEIPVNTTTAADQEFAEVAVAADGRFLVVWESDGQDGSFGSIVARLFGADGAPLTGEIAVNTTTLDNQNDPVVVAVANGFRIAWESDAVDGSGEAVVMRSFDLDAMPTSGEVTVNLSTSGDQEDPDLAVLADGRFAVVWESDGQDGDGESVVARVFAADGTALTGELVLNQTILGDQQDPRLTALGADSFAAAWVGPAPGGILDVWLRRFDVDALELGDEIRVTAPAAAPNDVPDLAADGNGSLVTSWLSFTGDGDGAGVFARRYEVAFFADGFESGDLTAWSSSVP